MHIHTRMMLAALLVLGAGAALADTTAGGVARPNPDAAGLPPGVVLEGSVETTTDAVIFPGDASGRLQVRACDGCALSTIQVDGQTLYLLGGDSVSLKAMAQYALRTSGHALTIHYRLRDKVATRVTVLVR